MKKFKYILLLMITCLITFSFMGCKNTKLKAYQKSMNESLNDVKKLKTDLVVTDNEEVVYGFTKEVIFSKENNATVITTSKTLDQSFNLREEITTENIENIDRNKLLNINLQSKYFDSYSIKNQNFVGQISKDNIKNVFGEDFKIKDVANLVITFENNVMVKMECTYLTESSKSVKMTSNYEY